ncbi:MAG TPA: sigma-70 family RNA polymerase sigma factor [Longimicrobium sp.]
MDEADLIRRARLGEERAAAELYRAHAPRLFAALRRIAGDDAAAEDWAQEAWIRVLTSLDRFRGESRFSTWLYRVAFNVAASLRRSRRWGRGEVELGEETKTVEADEARVLDRLTLEGALARLTPSMRSVLVLHDVEGYRHDEIAAMLGIGASTSRSQLFKARARMEALLGERTE